MRRIPLAREVNASYISNKGMDSGIHPRNETPPPVFERSPDTVRTGHLRRRKPYGAGIGQRMNGKPAPRIYTFIALLLIPSFITTVPIHRVNAAMGFEPQPHTKTLTGVRLVYHSFTGSEMKDSYEYAPYLAADLLLIRGHHGASFEIGYLYREGEPALLGSEWNVLSTTLDMWAVPITVSYLYFIRGAERARGFTPYMGVGLGTFVGGEKIGATATTLLKKWDGWAWGFRGSLIGNAVLGMNISPWHGLAAVIEVRWIESGRGGNIDLVDNEYDPLFDDYLYPLVRRSSYDFTGWSVSIGLRW